MKDNKVYLEDIRNAIDWILNDFVGDMGFKEFSEDKKTQDAVVRQIAIIGEALNKLDKGFVEEHKELPVREAVAMRNVLVHDYDMVDLDELWRAIQEDLPPLREIVNKLL